MEKIAFIDLEASGLGPASWPIEVGWCFERGKPQAHLIRPAEDWKAEAWDKGAEALHGIPIDKLRKSGRTPEDVCEGLNRALAGVSVYSDAPDWDGFWLYRLYKAAGVKQVFALNDFGAIFAGAAPADKEAAIAEAARTTPHRHRACEDVLHMREVYRLLKNRC